MMTKFIPIACLLLSPISLKAEASANKSPRLVEIQTVSTNITWVKKSTEGGGFRKLPLRMSINKIRYKKEETRFFFSIEDVVPGWNNFRLVPFLPTGHELSIANREEALLRLGHPMSEIKKDDYMDWRYIAVAASGEARVLFVAMTFGVFGDVKEYRLGRGGFKKIIVKKD